MFDFVRKHNKLMQILLFVLLVPSFVLLGISGFDRFRQQGATVAEVDGRAITQPEWDAAFKNDTDRVRERMPNVDPKLLDSPEAKYASLEHMVRERVLVAAANKYHFSTSDQQLAQALMASPQIASLRKPDGQLDVQRYTQLLASQGMTPQMFEEGMRADLTTQQVTQGVSQTAFASNAVADTALNAYFEHRDIQTVAFNPADYASKVALSDAQLQAYYNAHPALFQAPEQANIDYVVLDVDSIAKTISISDADLKSYYDQNLQRYGSPEQRRASHILIAVAKNATPEERQKAKARAEQLVADAKKSPDNFAALAKANSQDPGSAPKGGDLDYFSRGAMTKPFEDAVFGMQKGEIIGPVETDFGYHIIRLTDIKPAVQKTFEQAKPDIEAELKKQQAQKQFVDVADAFTNGVYEQADSVKPIADRMKLTVQTATGVTRKPAAGVTGVLASQKFLNAIFAPDSIEKKHNTQAIETGSNQLAAAHVTQYTPAHTLAFAEVKDKVQQMLMAETTAAMARKEGMASLTTWQANPTTAKWSDSLVVSRDNPQKLPAEVVQAALRADTSKLPVVVGVDLGPAGYTVVRVNKVEPAVATEHQAQDRQQYTQWWSTAEGQAYYAYLQQQFKASIKVPKPLPGAVASDSGSNTSN